MAGKSYIKVGTYDWDRIKKMYIKTGGQTWSAIRKAYVKTDSGFWRKVFDTASNRPFIAGNDIPKIRLNTFRTGSSYNPAGTLDDPVDPLVEAPPVQQMGPSWTSPTYGWPYESLGRHLWGYDGTWTSGNGTSMTFVYTWLYNLTGNSNDNTAELNATSTTGRTDMLTNLSSHLGQSDGDYFDKNFLTFRVTATNSAGNASAESAPVYIVREVPTGSITMVSPTLAFTNSSMSATFTYSNNWYNKTDISNSYIEWFAVDNLGDALTNTNRVQIETLSSIAVSGTTSKSGTTSHVPTIASKYYYVKMTLNNSGTQNAVIAITGFTPKSSVTSQSNKTVVTGAVLDPQAFNTISYVKNFPSSGSGGVVRTTSLSWNASTNATRYEIEYEGSYNNSSWTTVQSFAASPYTSSTSQSVSWGSPKPAGGFDYYTYMRARVRASNTTSATQVIGDGGSYIYASGVAPGQPSFGTITTTGTTASIPVTAGSAGSNYLYSPPFEYQYRTSGGSYSGTWTSSSSPISLTGLSGGTTYYIKIRTKNYDELVSPENETTFQTTSVLTPPSIYYVSAGDSSGQPVTVYFSGGSGPYYQIWWTLGVGGTGYDEYGYSSPITDNTGPTSASTNWYAYVRSVSALTNVGTGPSSTISDWSPGYQFTVTQANVITYGSCEIYGSPYYSYSSYDCYGTYSYAYTDNYYYQRRQILVNGSWNGSYDYSCGNTSVRTYGSFSQVNGQCGYSPPSQTPAITSGPNISWASGNNFTLSASASNATNLEFQVEFANQSGGPALSTQTFFFGASSGGGTTGSQQYSWARTRVRANNSSTGLSSSFSGYTGWA